MHEAQLTPLEPETAPEFKTLGLEMLQKMLVVDATPPTSNKKIPSSVESKYRKRYWFGKVLLSFDFLLPFIDNQELKNKIAVLKKKWTSPEFTLRTRLTKKEDIDEADQLIEEVLTFFGIDLKEIKPQQDLMSG